MSESSSPKTEPEPHTSPQTRTDPVSVPLENPHITMRGFPPLSHTFNNILTSLYAICVAVLSLLFTICILPLSLFRASVSEENLSLTATATEEAREFFGTRDERKVVLIVGASRRVGFELLKLYAVGKDTRIIAVSTGADLPALRARVTDLGNSVTALFRFESMDLGDTKGVSNTVKHLDEVYGPISHVFVVCGIPAHLTEHPDAWKLDPTVEMVQRNIIGTVAIVLPMMECMGARRYGKIGVVSSGYATPTNMLSHAGTTAFLKVYLAYLRVLGSIVNVDVVDISVEHAFANGLTDNVPGPAVSIPGSIPEYSSSEEKLGGDEGSSETKSTLSLYAEGEREMLEDLARTIWKGVEGGGVATIGWPARKYMMATAARAANPLVQQFQRWAYARHRK